MFKVYKAIGAKAKRAEALSNAYAKWERFPILVDMLVRRCFGNKKTKNERRCYATRRKCLRSSTNTIKSFEMTEYWCYLC